MQPRVDLISLGVRSVDASRRFYVDGLGWPVHREVPGEVLFIQANHGLVLSLWDAGQMQSEAATDPPAGVPCITLSHNLASAAEVDAVMADAGRAGATVVAGARTQPWAATPATSPIPTATAGRSPSIPLGRSTPAAG
jgi:uncharacterized protein